MRIQNIFIVSAILWPVTTLAQQFYDGNALYGMCAAPPEATVQQSECAGYVTGVADTLVMTKQICLPSRVIVREVVDVVIKYLRDNPAMRHYSAASDIGVALTDSFPCQNSK